MNGFDSARLVEAKALRALDPYLKEESDHGAYVLTYKGALAKVMQESFGDVLRNRAGSLEAIELKAEEKWTGNLFLETFSNRNLEDAASYAKHGINPGWLYKLRADFLLYYFLDKDMLCIMHMRSLQKWAFGSDGTQAAADAARKRNNQDSFIGLSQGRLYDYPEKEQHRYDQCNETLGRCVPVRILEEELKPPLKRVKVIQRNLGLEQEVA
jgi:hypothetical protein